jgi:hypothetical protein
VTSFDADELESTRSMDIPPVTDGEISAPLTHESYAAPEDPHPRALDPARPEQVLYVPLAVTVGDGFKFGCGFFLAQGIVVMVAFVVFAALFAMVSFMGISLPIGQ